MNTSTRRAILTAHRFGFRDWAIARMYPKATLADVRAVIREDKRMRERRRTRLLGLVRSGRIEA